MITVKSTATLPVVSACRWHVAFTLLSTDGTSIGGRSNLHAFATPGDAIAGVGYAFRCHRFPTGKRGIKHVHGVVDGRPVQNAVRALRRTGGCSLGPRASGKRTPVRLDGMRRPSFLTSSPDAAYNHAVEPFAMRVDRTENQSSDLVALAVRLILWPASHPSMT